MAHGLDICTFEIDDDENVVIMDFNSLVDLPAHMKPFVTFSGQKATFSKAAQINQDEKNYFVASEEERVVMGVLISAGTPIYRNDNGHEYFGIFTKPTITKIKERFMQQGFMHNMNTMHNAKQVVKGAFMTDIFQIDSKKGIACPECLKGQNLQDGTLVGAYKITDDVVWSKIKDGTYRGFSIEAYLDIKKANVKKANMSKQRTGLFRIPKFFTSDDAGEETKVFAEATTSDGTVLKYEGDLGEGTPVFMEVNDEDAPAAPGEYEVTLADGSVKLITVDDNGVVSAMEDVQEMSEEGNAILAAVEQTLHRKMSALTKKFETVEAENKKLREEVEALKKERKGSKFDDNRTPASGEETGRKRWTSGK